MSCALVKAGQPTADRFDHVLSTWKKASNSSNVSFNNSVYLSERETADRNFALAYFMRENNAFPEGTDIKKTLEFYFQCCSIETNAKNVATVAATLANGGVCPFSNEKVFESSTVKHCLSLMHMCGMYDYSGEFSFSIGLPAKSGVSGAVYVVVPNTLGICIWSPRLDHFGNSVRAIEFCKELTKTFLFHNYDSLVSDHGSKINPRIRKEIEGLNLVQSMCDAAARGDISQIQSLVIRGGDVNGCDYDRRYPLHLAACEEQMKTVEYLLSKGAKVDVKDRWGQSPLDEAQKTENKKLIQLLLGKISPTDEETTLEETKNSDS